MREIANCVCQFVLAARGWFQLCDEFENVRSKCVKTRVIPWTCWFAWLWFFPEIDKLHLRVHKNGAAFADIFAARNRDDCIILIGKIGDASVILRADQNIAITQNEWRIACKTAGK